MNRTHTEQEPIEIRRAQTLGDFEACLDIQQQVWNFQSPHEGASVPLMRVQDRYGGAVLVAENSDGVCGFAYALLCRASGIPFWWSHMTAVRPQFQGRGLGFRLKLAQREAALGEGIDQIRWTFDPLQALNAHFNVRKLGTVASSYEENLYGISSSPLHRDLPTDRIETRWELASDRVVDRMTGTAVILRDFDGLVRALENREGKPGHAKLEHRENPVLVEIPLAYPSATVARRWQDSLRLVFRHYLAEGYRVTDFILMDTPSGAFYVLER